MKIQIEHQHHEQALSLLQQLLLTGSCVIPSALVAADGIKKKFRKGKGKK